MMNSKKGRSHVHSDKPLVLVSGIGRSGITCLRLSLAQHPDIHSTGTENNILYDILNCAIDNSTIESRRNAMQVSAAEYDRAFKQLILGLLWPVPEAECQQISAFSNMTPDTADYLVRLFGKLHIVYIVRSGVEVVESRRRFAGFREATFAEQCLAWRRCAGMAEWGRANPQHFTLVRHESLLDRESAAEVFCRIFAKAGLPASDAPLSYLLEQWHHATSMHDGHENPVRMRMEMGERAKRAERWTGSERREFKALCGDGMSRFGYPMPSDTDRPARRTPQAEGARI